MAFSVTQEGSTESAVRSLSALKIKGTQCISLLTDKEGAHRTDRGRRGREIFLTLSTAGSKPNLCFSRCSPRGSGGWSALPADLLRDCREVPNVPFVLRSRTLCLGLFVSYLSQGDGED